MYKDYVRPRMYTNFPIMNREVKKENKNPYMGIHVEKNVPVVWPVCSYIYVVINTSINLINYLASTSMASLS